MNSGINEAYILWKLYEAEGNRSLNQSLTVSSDEVPNIVKGRVAQGVAQKRKLCDYSPDKQRWEDFTLLFRNFYDEEITPKEINQEMQTFIKVCQEAFAKDKVLKDKKIWYVASTESAASVCVDKETKDICCVLPVINSCMISKCARQHPGFSLAFANLNETSAHFQEAFRYFNAGIIAEYLRNMFNGTINPNERQKEFETDKKAFDYTVSQGINPILAAYVLFTFVENPAKVEDRFDNLITYARSKGKKFSQETQKQLCDISQELLWKKIATTGIVRG